MKKGAWIVGLVFGVLLTSLSWGAVSETKWQGSKEPLTVDADVLEARADDGLVIFEGHVVARQGDLDLQADRLEVEADLETRDILMVRARGNVRLQRLDVVATGETATYDARVGIVVLEGSPKVWRGRDLVSGTRITVHLADNRVQVTGARAVLHPESAPGGEEH